MDGGCGPRYRCLAQLGRTACCSAVLGVGAAGTAPQVQFLANDSSGALLDLLVTAMERSSNLSEDASAFFDPEGGRLD